MGFQDILAAIDIITGPDPSLSILGLSIVVAMGLLWLCKQALARFYKAGIFVAALALVALFASVRLSLLWLTGVASTILAVCLLVLLVNYFLCAERLDEIVVKADPSLPNCDYVAAFKLMNSVDRDRLSRRQLACLDKDRIFCNIYLGNNGVAKRMLENENLKAGFQAFRPPYYRGRRLRSCWVASGTRKRLGRDIRQDRPFHQGPVMAQPRD